jgi:hypothetical protein
MPTANGKMGCPMEKADSSTLMAAAILAHSSREFQVARVDSRALRDGTTKVSCSNSRPKAKECSLSKR